MKTLQDLGNEQLTNAKKQLISTQSYIIHALMDYHRLRDNLHQCDNKVDKKRTKRHISQCKKDIKKHYKRLHDDNKTIARLKYEEERLI